MKVYLDADFKCHVDPEEGFREINTDFFDGKCREFIEGYRFVPLGERWMRPDGTFFRGEMVSPWKDYNTLESAQKGYETANAQNKMMLGGTVSAYERSMVATCNYEIGDLIVVGNQAYEVIHNIPNGGKIIEYQNVVKTTVTEYMEEKENG